jgi:hypothetical protein
MLSPSPTQQPPVPPVLEPKPEEKKVVYTKKRRAGETPAALAIKAVLRPIIKVFYYVLRFAGTHKLISLAMVILFIAGIFGTNILVTHELPFGIGDPFYSLSARSQASADNIKAWLYAVRDGDQTTLRRFNQQIASVTTKTPPDPAQLVAQFSQSQAQVKWKAINVIAVYGEVDTTLDTFVEIDMALPGVGGNAIVIWHFTTVPATADPNLNGIIIFIDLVTFHKTLV